LDIIINIPKVKVILDYKELSRKIGSDLAKKVQARYAQLEAYQNVKQLLNGIGNPHILVGDLKGHIAMNLDANNRLIIAPLVPAESSDEIFNAATQIEIRGVKDYHGANKNTNKWLIP